MLVWRSNSITESNEFTAGDAAIVLSFPMTSTVCLHVHPPSPSPKERPARMEAGRDQAGTRYSGPLSNRTVPSTEPSLRPFL